MTRYLLVVCDKIFKLTRYSQGLIFVCVRSSSLLHSEATTFVKSQGGSWWWDIITVCCNQTPQLHEVTDLINEFIYGLFPTFLEAAAAAAVSYYYKLVAMTLFCVIKWSHDPTNKFWWPADAFFHCCQRQHLLSHREVAIQHLHTSKIGILAFSKWIIWRI